MAMRSDQTSVTNIQDTLQGTLDHWQGIRDEIQLLQRSIEEIDDRLDSWGLATWEAIGLGVDSVSDDSHLYILPIEKLSRADLKRKKELFHDKIDELNAELRSQNAVVRQLKFDAKIDEELRHEEFVKKQHAQIIEDYNANPFYFLNRCIFDISPEWVQQQGLIFDSAEKLILVCHLFKHDLDVRQLWQGWKIVAKARNIAFEEYTNYFIDKTTVSADKQDLFARNEEYSTGAKTYFLKLIDLLPAGMQGLKFLYDVTDFDRVDYFLTELFADHIFNSQTEYQSLLIDLACDINDLSIRETVNKLEKNSLYKKLPKNLKNQVIIEYAFTNRLQFDLLYSARFLSSQHLDTINSYLKQIEDHAKLALHGRSSLVVSQAEFGKIKLHLDDYVSQVRSEMIPLQHSDISIGTGLGLGWLLGIEDVVRSFQQPLPPSEHNISSAHLISTADSKFIIDEDNFWHMLNKPKFPKVANKGFIRRALTKSKKIFAKEGSLYPDNKRYTFIVPDKILIPLNEQFPGYVQRLSAHFKRRAKDIRAAIEQARKTDNPSAVDIISNDLDKLELDWQQILISSYDPHDFCSVVDLYLTRRYMSERTQYMEVAGDIQKDPYVDDERKALLYEYQIGKKELLELHDLKEQLYKAIGPNT